VVHVCPFPIKIALHPTPLFGGGIVRFAAGQPPVQLLPVHDSRSELFPVRLVVEEKLVPGEGLMKQESIITWPTERLTANKNRRQVKKNCPCNKILSFLLAIHIN